MTPSGSLEGTGGAGQREDYSKRQKWQLTLAGKLQAVVAGEEAEPRERVGEGMQATLGATDPTARTRKEESRKPCRVSADSPGKGECSFCLVSERGRHQSRAGGLRGRPVPAGRCGHGAGSRGLSQTRDGAHRTKGTVLTKARMTLSTNGDAGRRMGCGCTALLTCERGCQGFQAKAPGRVEADTGAISL